MRFFIADAVPSGLPEIAAGLRALDATFEIRGKELYRGLELLGNIAVLAQAHDLLARDVRDLSAHVDAVGGELAPVVKARLQGAPAAVIVEVLRGKRGTESTLELLAPLWQWLFEHHDGLLQTDGEGFYDADKLLLEMA